MSIEDFNVKIFVDDARPQIVADYSSRSYIKGVTTNPTIMRSAGITDYRGAAMDLIMASLGKPISFEVFADGEEAMYREAMAVASWGSNVYVKVPVTNTLGHFSGSVIERLTDEGVKINVTAVMTSDQVRDIMPHLDPDIPAIISYFAGRVADTGRDATIGAETIKLMMDRFEDTKWELLWASPRQVFDVVSANRARCDIITMTPILIDKLAGLDKDLGVFSLETARMFGRDAAAAGFSIL